MIENDYELIHLAQEDNEDAINYIYNKYKPIIIKKSNLAIQKISHHGIEINDIMQEAYIALKKAIDSFKEQDETTFYTFANLCIDRRISNYINKNKTGKDKILNEAIFINDNLSNILTTSFDTEKEVLEDVEETKIINKLLPKLSQSEKDAFILKLKGYNLQEIAKELNKDQKSIYNTLSRVKDKIKKIMKNTD